MMDYQDIICDTCDGEALATELYALKLYCAIEESHEDVRALQEKRAPDFRRWAK